MKMNLIEELIQKKILIREVDVAEYWGISKYTLRRWRSTGEGPVFLKIGWRVLYPRMAIKEYERTRLFRSTSCRITETEGDSSEK